MEKPFDSLMLWNFIADGALLIAGRWRRTLGGHLNVQIAAVRTGGTERRRYWR